jgi:mono/diheme cytochrome c family protein
MALGAAPWVCAQSSATTPPAQRPLTDRYCVACHNQKLKTGGVALEGVDAAHASANAEVLEKVLRKIRTGEMPPPGLPRPTPAEAAAFSASIESALDQQAALDPNPGRPVIHRLNRSEYSNAIRDLLGLDIDAGSTLPVDDSGFGFDNIGAVLSVSPALLERFMSAARMVSRLAVGDPAMKPTEDEFVCRARRNERSADGLPFDSRGGLAISYYFPLDAEYTIRVKFTGEDSGGPYELRMAFKAGLHSLGATFLREAEEPELAIPLGRGIGPTENSRPSGSGLKAEMDLRLDGSLLKRFEVSEGAAMPQIDRLVVSGPFNATGPGDTLSRQKIFVCRPPADGKDDQPCARLILSRLARQAFRRPVTDTDLKPLMAFYETGRQERDFDRGIEKALRAMLVSPNFLFRIERDPAGAAAGTVYRIPDGELASRLSFFLWSSAPDGQLLDLAEKGRLRDPAVLASEVRRMLADRRSDALISNFVGQWLYLRNLATVKPDPDVFPEFDDSLRQSYRQETELFVASVFRENRSVLDLLNADYTFLNQRLAEHYGVPGIYGSQFRRVTMTDPNRGGLLGQGSILTVTSYPNRTSVVQRGKWILENLLGTPPPPPPPGVADLKPHGEDGRKLTIREAMEQHRTDSVCASCHSRMDPLGFALENYDGVGKFRATDAGKPIDASGKLPDGSRFNGPAGLKQALLESHRDEYLTTLTQKLLTYALGRGLEYYDQPAVRAILRDAAGGNYSMPALVTAIVRSTPFQMRRTPEP